MSLPESIAAWFAAQRFRPVGGGGGGSQDRTIADVIDRGRPVPQEGRPESIWSVVASGLSGGGPPQQEATPTHEPADDAVGQLAAEISRRIAAEVRLATAEAEVARLRAALGATRPNAT